MYVLYILWLQVCKANLLLHGTTAVRGGSETLKPGFSSGKDAAGSISSDVSTPTETRSQNYTRMYSFGADASYISKGRYLVFFIRLLYTRPHENRYPDSA